MEIAELKSQHRNKSFETIGEFDQWLAETTSKEIILAHLGQDMTKMWVDDKGEILHCNFHASIYNGNFVNLDSLEEFCPIEILEEGHWKTKLGLLVDEIKNTN